MATDLIAPLFLKYANYNIISDPAPEKMKLSYSPFENPAESIPADGRLILVLIEPRVLALVPGATAADDLESRLLRFKGDLRAEGLHSRFINAEVFRPTTNQDGRIVITLRKFFIDVKALHPNFEGVIFIGSFPEASLVRRWTWAPSWPQTIKGQQKTGQYLSIYPELVDNRTDIILSDLTGNWESLYQENFYIEGIIAYPDSKTAAKKWATNGYANTGSFSSTEYEVSSIPFADAFYVDDARYSNLSMLGGILNLQVQNVITNPEVTTADLSRPNPVARPDISVSRINAYNIAVDADPALKGSDGHAFLDAHGNPQTVKSSASLGSADQSSFFKYRNPLLERRLYNTYFDRNHSFRNGAFESKPFRVGAISGDKDFVAADYASLLHKASSSFATPVVKERANLADYVEFFKQPAVLRYILSHSNNTISGFENTASASAIATSVGGNPVRWVRNGDTYVPSYEGLNGVADLFIHRAMYHNQSYRNGGASIVVHGGCNVNSVSDTSLPYHDKNYAAWQNAEGILFFTNTVSLLSRAKLFNDSLDGFPQGFAANDKANVGSAFKAYHEHISGLGALQADAAQNKRSYNWSISGDWTLRIKNQNGIGLLQLKGSNIETDIVHPDKRWIGGWLFDKTKNTIRHTGDIDGDGLSEFVITSNWGIGILKHKNGRWRQLMIAPNDTWFGQWRYSINDTIHGVSNLTGGSKQEIVISSPWGLACLSWNGSILNSSFILKNGSRIGGWLLNTVNDKIAGFGKLTTTQVQEAVFTSPWGLGIINFSSNSSPVMVANGTMLSGGWRINTADNEIAAIADFDGDGYDETFIRSPWGVAILKVESGTLVTKAIYANNTVLSGNYTVKNTDKVWGVADFLGGKVAMMIIATTNGIAVVKMSGSALIAPQKAVNGTRIGGWMLNTADNRGVATGSFAGNGRAQLAIASPWGIGIIGLDVYGRFINQALHHYGSNLGDWVLGTGDKFIAGAHFTGAAGTAQLLVMK